jgi:hypothetical protein
VEAVEVPLAVTRSGEESVACSTDRVVEAMLSVTGFITP